MDGILYLKKIDDVEWVVFNEFFNSKITKEILQFLSKYKRIKFGSNCNQQFDTSIDYLDPYKSPVLPNSITDIEFGANFNQPISKKLLPKSLKTLILGKNFDQVIHSLPSTLTYLEFYGYFNRPIDNLPNSLTYLEFGEDFNQPVDNFPRSLNVLHLFTFQTPILTTLKK
jgi:hypothetical protein